MIAASIRRADERDLLAVVSVHEAAFPGFFLTLLGPQFLTELYRAFIRERDGACWVVEAADPGHGTAQIVGVVAGTLRPAHFYRRLLFRRGAHFALAALPALLRHPARVPPRLLGAIAYRGERPAGIEDAALLSSLAVNPAASGQGLGKALADAFCENAARCNVSKVYLTTDQHDNEAVKAFYERAGFSLLSSFTRRNGRVMNTYLRSTDTFADEH